jgi:type II secretory pathway component PulK
VAQSNTSSVDRITSYAKILEKLFRKLGFDNELLEPDHTQITPGVRYDSKQLVSVLRDYLDKDDNPSPDFNISAGFPEGIDGSGGASDQLKNGFLDSPEELLRVPGFTPNRVRQLAPYVTAHRNPNSNDPSPSGLNFNFAPLLLLQSLHDNITDAGGQALYDKSQQVNSQTQEQGYASTSEVISELNGQDPTEQASKDLTSLLTVDAQYFRIIGSVEYGVQGTYLAQAIVRHDSSGAEIEFLTLY